MTEAVSGPHADEGEPRAGQRLQSSRPPVRAPVVSDLDRIDGAARPRGGDAVLDEGLSVAQEKGAVTAVLCEEDDAPVVLVLRGLRPGSAAEATAHAG